jgi:K+-transporting ATPase ATPase A chain
MSVAALALYGAFFAIVAVLVLPAGAYMTWVFGDRRPTAFERATLPVERGIFRLAGIDPAHEMTWSEYALAFIRFSALVALVIYVILRLQTHVPWFQDEYMGTPMTRDLAMNTAVSFSTTTTWQAYGGETTMSYLSQMAAITMGSFLAGASGLAVGVAFIRGFSRERTNGLGNFWVDVVRATLWVLLPLALAGSLFLIWQGVPANLRSYTVVTTVEGDSQVIAQGPVAVLEFIKNLGTNGGGFFNVNGAHPYANPNAFTNFVGMLAIAVLPASLTRTFGLMTGRRREGWMLFAVMAVLFAVGLAVTGIAEQRGNANVADAAGIERSVTDSQPGGNMEGKEVRFGISGSALTSNTTSNGATGSFNSMHDSYMPLGNAAPLVNMLLGEPIFGGLGTGLYSMILMVLLALFFAGLMTGRTPEFLGETVGPSESRLVGLYVIAFPFVVLCLTAVAVVAGAGQVGLTLHSGAHGFTEIVFAYASSAANNGLTMASLNANSVFYNTTTVIAMLVGRFVLAVLALALAGQFAQKATRPVTIATVSTASVLFAAYLVAIIAIIGGLSYFIVLALGPVAEQLGS